MNRQHHRKTEQSEQISSAGGRSKGDGRSLARAARDRDFDDKFAFTVVIADRDDHCFVLSVLKGRHGESLTDKGSFNTSLAKALTLKGKCLTLTLKTSLIS